LKPVEQTRPEPVAEPSPTLLPESSFELDFGKVWFVRIGIVILLTGLVFLGNYAYQNWIREMPNGVRLAALFACALALVETGRRLAKKESLSRFGEVLLAGGMAFFYYCTFAAYHVERLRVIESAALGAILLSAAALSIAAVSWLRQAKATAILGIVLASYATMLQPIGWMSCLSNLLLGGLGLFFMLRPGWSGPGWASMLGSYGAFLGWQLFGASGENVRMDDPATLWFLPPVWIMFAIPGAVARFRESLSDRARAWFTAANNAFFFLLFSGVWLHQHDDVQRVSVSLGRAAVRLRGRPSVHRERQRAHLCSRGRWDDRGRVHRGGRRLCRRRPLRRRERERHAERVRALLHQRRQLQRRWRAMHPRPRRWRRRDGARRDLVLDLVQSAHRRRLPRWQRVPNLRRGRTSRPLPHALRGPSRLRH